MNMNDNSLATSQWLKAATKQLEQAGIGTARLDALVLLCDVTGKDRTHLLAHPELELTREQQIILKKLLERRAKHEPLAYIREKTEFYGREFYINHDVLEPRPESETMIELLEGTEAGTIIDVGTGSGALAVCAALLQPNAQIFAVDIDPKCLFVAKENAKKHEVTVQFMEGNLLEPFTTMTLPRPTVVLANLPYVPDEYTLNRAAENEPKLAIFGGPDGLKLYRALFTQLSSHFTQPAFVFTESLPFQHEELLNIAITHGFTQIADQDFIQVFRKDL